ncbi:MAG: outer membrane protein assembly factor BamD [Ignavibacteria bacterium]|nr:outer membrane protein assembly factor BamD [Ignavibacteria bacterium]
MTLLQNHQRLLNGSKFFLIFLSIFSQSLLAQNLKDFENGIESFNNKNYPQAILYLQKFIQKPSANSETATLLLILSYFYSQDYLNAKNLIQKFESDYPNSHSLQAVLETKISIAVFEQDFESIKSSLISLNKLNIGRDKLQEYINLFRKIFSFAKDDKIFEIGTFLSNPVLRFAYLRVYFESIITNKNTTQIKNVYRELYQLGSRNGFLNTNKIGVLIPSNFQSNSPESIIIEGLKFAIHKFNEENDKNLELKIFKGDKKQLEKSLIELAKNPEVICVIGPLYSDQFRQLSILADKLCIPFISPTATATDISIKSKYIFQFNPTLDVRGYAMSAYAIDKLKLKRFAILNSEEQNFKAIGKVIKDKIINSKCELIAEVNWKEDKNNLVNKIREIRKAGLNKDLVIRFNSLMDFETEQKLISYGLTQAGIDSFKSQEAEVSIFEIFGRDAEKICQLNRIHYYKRTKSVLNDFSVPVYTIDAVFIPISNNNLISEIVNEINRQNIITQIIGNDIWNSKDDLNKAYPASNGVVFTSDFYLDTDDETVKALSTEIYEYTGIQLSRTFFYGFETGNKILVNWFDGINRENFYDVLVSDVDYEGIGSEIILNKNGVNSAVYILEYRNRKIRKIDKIITN